MRVVGGIAIRRVGHPRVLWSRRVGIRSVGVGHPRVLLRVVVVWRVFLRLEGMVGPCPPLLRAHDPSVPPTPSAGRVLVRVARGGRHEGVGGPLRVRATVGVGVGQGGGAS